MPQDNPNQQVTIEEWEERVRDHFKIPKGLWKAIPSQESGGDWDAKSPTGVRGKYQVTERTAKGYNLDRNDPYQQVVAAARTLKDNYDRLGTIKDDRARWLGATGRYYAGDDGVDAQGNLSTGSKDGVSNAATHVERVAKYWGDFERQAGGAGGSAAAPSLVQSNTEEAAAIVPATPAPRRAKPGPIKTLSRGPVVTPEQRLTQNADPFSISEASGFRSEAQKAYERTSGLGKGRPTGLHEAINQFARSGARGLAQIPQGLTESMQMPISPAERRLNETFAKGDPKKLAEIEAGRHGEAAAALKPYTDRALKTIDQAIPVDPNDQSWLTQKIPAAAGSIIPSLIAARTGRMVGAPSAMTSAITGIGQTVAPVAEELDKAGIKGPQRDRSIGLAMLGGSTEAVGLGRALDKIGVKQPAVSRLLNVGEDVAQEYTQEYIDDVNAKLVGKYNPNASLSPFSANKLEAAALGGIVGGGVQAIGSGAAAVSDIATDPRGAAEAIKGAVERVVDPKTANLRRATARGLGRSAPDALVGQDLRQKYAGAVRTSPIMETLRTLEPDAHFDIEEVLNRGLRETDGEDSDLRTIYQNAKQQKTVQEILSVMEPGQQADPEAAINRGLRAQAPGPDLRATYGNAPQQNTVQQILGARENLAAQQQAAEAQAQAAEIERQQRESAAAAQQAELERQANAPTTELPPPPTVSPAQQERNNRIRIARQVSVEAQAQAQQAEAAGDYAGALAGVEAARSAVDDLMKAMRKEGSAGAIKLRAQLKGEKAALDARVGNLRKLAKGAPASRSGRPAARGQAGALATPAPPQAPSAPLLNSIVNPEGGNPKSPTLPTDFDYLAAQQKRGQDNRLANMGILSRIRSLGGIRPGINAGELVNAREKRYPGLLNQNGIPADTLIEYLAEDGYPVDRNDLNTLWDAIDQAAAGKAVLPMDRQRDTRDLGGNGESYSEYLARTNANTGALPETANIPAAPPVVGAEVPPRRKTERQRVPPRVADEGIAALDARRAELSRLKYDRGGVLPDDLADEFRELGSVIYAYQNEMAGREENDYPPYVKAAPMTPRAKAEFEKFLADGRKMFDDLARQAHLKEEAEAYEKRVDAYLADPETEAEIRAALTEFEQNGIGPAVDLVLSENEEYELSERAREDLLEGLAAATKLESDRESAPAPVVGRGETGRTVTDTERTADSAAPARSSDWRPNKSLEEFQRMADAQLEEYRDWLDNQQRKEVTQGASDLDPASFVTQRTRLKSAWQKRWPKGEHSWSNWRREKPAPRETTAPPVAPASTPTPEPATAMQVRYESATRHWGDWSARAESDGETIRVIYEHEGEEYPYELPMAGFVGTGARAEEILTGSGVPLSKRATPGSTVRQYIANLGLDAAFEVRKQADARSVEEPTAETSTPDLAPAKAKAADSLSGHFASLLASGREFASITEARAEAAKFLGEDVKPGTAIAKTVDEAIEVAVVQSAREIVRQGGDPQTVYRGLVDLLDRQPNLNVRTSTSVAQQAYSTPAPLAYVASHLAGIGKYTTVYEPTAGNGMLLIAADPANVQANELNPERAQALKEQGFATTSEDAVTHVPPKRADVVIANPPFGVVRDEQGNSKKYKVLLGYDTTEVDHAIAFQALAEGLKNNGKAVLIVGSVAKTAQSEKARADAYNAAAKRRFYYNLYRDYNVVDHFTVSGEMYSKQGAAWPVDVIVIHGQGKSSLPLPAVKAPRIYENYTQLAEVLTSPAGANSRVGIGEQPGSVGDPGRTGTDARSGRLPDIPGEPNREDDGRVGEPAGRGSDSAPAVGGRGTTGRVGGPDVAGSDNQQSVAAGETVQPGRAPEEGRKSGEGKPGGTDSAQGNRPGGVVEPSGKINTAALNNLFNEALADVFGEDATPITAQPELKPEPKPKPAKQPAAPREAKPSSEKPTTTPRPVKESAKDAVKSGAKTMDEIAKGLGDLFGDPSRMSSGLTFDEKTYAKAKVHFQAAVEHFKDTAKSVNEVMRSLIQTLRDQYGFTADTLRRMQQYVVRFVQEYTAKPAAQTETAVKPAPAPAIAKDSETHRVYKPVSKARSVDTLVPVNMATATEASVSNLREQVGELHEYVADKLDYDPATIADYFSGEQLDALALAIHNIERGDGFIIGDQTGIGKGRIVAGVIRYAMKTGKTPIFVTEKPPLYGDMVRDLTDIGMAVQGATPPQTRSWPKVIRPLITNNGEAVPISDEAMEWAAEAEKAREAGKKAPPRPKSGFIETAAGPQHTALLNAVANRGMQGAGYDVVFTTYSQMQKKLGESAPRHIVLDRLAEGGVIVLDESHNAGGGKPKTDKDGEIIEDRAIFVRKLARKASAVFYSSATYAKRPEVMDLYFKTDLGKAVADITTLPDVINRGGIPLQQVVASMLSKAGQYMRRERSFQGVEYNVTTSEVNREAAEQVATVFRGIIAFQGLREAAVENLEDGLRGAGGTVGKDNAVSAESSNFTAIIHNVIDQMLLNLKAAPAADLAIESLKRGEKPIITVSNTMGAFLEQFTEENGIAPGDPLGVDFGGVLQRYLERMRRVTIKKGDNEAEHHYLSDDELSPQALETYYAVERMIRETDFSDMFISPIDRIHQRLRDAGYKTAEITGRNQIVDYSGQLPVYRTRPGAERSTIGKKRAINGFNDGSIDALIINQSGSTGISLHASEKFKDQRRRHMIIAQAEKNVDTHMQMLGRVHRTGQVIPPRYTQLSADVPAEKRPAAVLAKKMASLNANTTASRGSAVTAKDVVDFLNKYGDQVAFTVMEANPALHAALGSPTIKNDQDKPAEDAMRRLTGRIPILPLAEQEALYDLLESEYLDLVAREEAMGTNTLEAKTLALDAETISKDALSAARGGDSPFTQESYIERVRVKKLGKPMTSAQVTQLVQEAVGETGTLDELKEKGLKKTKEIISGVREETAAIVKNQQEQAEAQIAGFDKIIEQSDDPAAVSKAQKARDAAVLRKTNAKLQAEKDWNTWAAIAKTTHPGNSVVFSTENGVFYGIVTNLERKDKEGNPIARGKWRATIALADAARSITLPLSQITVEGLNEADKIEVRYEDAMPTYNAETGMVEYTPIVDAFDAGQSESTEIRNIVTGNILAGFAEVKGKGQITNYTDKDGKVQQGILMPKNWDREKELKSREVIFQTADQILQFVRGNNKVKSRDGGLTISTDARGRLQLVTPKAKAKGGPYFTNAKILAAIGRDFVSAGSQMRAEVSEDQLRRVVEILHADGISGSPVSLLADGSEEKARGIVEGKAVKDDQAPAFNLRQGGGRADLFGLKPDADTLREQSEMEAELAREEFAKVDARLTAINREIDTVRGDKQSRAEKRETRTERSDDARRLQKLRQEQQRLSQEYNRLEGMIAAADERTAEYQTAAQDEQWRRASIDRRRALLANNWTERGYERQRNGNWTRDGFPALTKADFENALNDDAAMARTEAPDLARDEKGRFAANNYWRTPLPTREPQTEAEAEEFVGHARSEFRQRSEGPGTLWINRQSATVIASAMKQLGRKVQSFAGVAVHVDQVRDVARFLDQRVEAYANGHRIADLIRDLEDAIADAEAHGYDRVAIVDTSYNTLAFNKSTTREERFHRWQSVAGIFSDNIGRGLHEVLKNDPVYTFMRDQLIAEGYAANDGRLLVSEASAKIASGQWREYGLESEQQGMDFLFRYMHAAYRTVGRQLFTDTIPGTARAKEIYQDVQEFTGEARPGGRIPRAAGSGQGTRDAGITPASVRRGDSEGAEGGGGGRSGSVPRSERRRSGDIGSLRGITLKSLRGEQSTPPPREPREPRAPRPAANRPSPTARPADLRSITSESLGLPTPAPRERRATAPRSTARAEAPREQAAAPENEGSLRERVFTTIGGLQAGVQLGSPGFVGRNVLQHIGYAVQSGMADRVAQIVDASFSTVTRRPRSVVVPGDPVSNSIRGVKNYIRGVKDAYAKHKAGEQIDGGSVEEVRNMPTNRVAQAVRSVLVYINEIPDAGNYAARLDRRMRILAATAQRNGVTMDEETMAAIVAQAELEAAHDSMRDDNFVSVSLKKLKEGLNATTSPITGTTRFGIGDFIVKYTQTPGALLKRGIEYSPFGLIEAAMHAGRATMGRGGEYEKRMAMQALGRALSGSASTIGLGAVLAAMGALVEPEKEDFTSEDLERERGVRGFSVNLSALARMVPAMLGGGGDAGKMQPGDKLVPIDWAQPWAMGASVGASMYNQVKQGRFSGSTTAGAAAQSFENMMDVMGDQSVLKNLREYIRAAKGRTFGEQAQNVAEKFLKGVPQSFAPSLTRQVGNVVDPKMRDYRPEERGGIKAALQEGGRRAVAGTVPGLSRRYPEKISTITGEPRKTAQGELSLGGRLLNLLSPVIVNEYKADALRDEIIRLNTLLEERDVSLFVPPLTEQQTKKPGYKEPTSLLREREGKFARSFAEQGHKLVMAPAFRLLSDAAKADAIRDLAGNLRAATYKKEQAESVGKIIQGSQKAARPARARRENQNLLPQYR